MSEAGGLSRLTGLGPERRMTRTHAVLWVVIAVATAADVVLTMAGLGVGLREGNLLVRTMMGAIGPAGLWLVKFGAMVWLVGGWAYLSDRNAAIFLALFAAVTVTVTLHNAALLLSL